MTPPGAEPSVALVRESTDDEGNTTKASTFQESALKARMNAFQGGSCPTTCGRGLVSVQESSSGQRRAIRNRSVDVQTLVVWYVAPSVALCAPNAQ
ncbi:hypothetical protein L596_019159 [Steinernema carpocapsae]|uniref:Uncharacterized protein n=1 Tax=Steinernema carpocapsae TaxID=34508 RepID=A0A4U5N817_STECR|nr:hypothetical protein L596_019159 [Steinernema carpocapsae]